MDNFIYVVYNFLLLRAKVRFVSFQGKVSAFLRDSHISYKLGYSKRRSIVTKEMPVCD